LPFGDRSLFFSSDRSLIPITKAEPNITLAETKSNIPIICSFTFSFTLQLTEEVEIGYKGSYDMFITFKKNKNSFQCFGCIVNNRLDFWLSAGCWMKLSREVL
jgi:hypothetical protein